MKSFVRFIPILMSLIIIQFIISCSCPKMRTNENFNSGWKFHLGDVSNASDISYNDSAWRDLNLPHDWSIEGKFSDTNRATPGGGALPGGIGWYRKTFLIHNGDKDKLVYIEFDGIYMNSEVWINGHYLGKRPNGYISFRYNLTPYLNFGASENTVAVKVDNSQQPNSRWYSGSGIYRNVHLIVTDKTAVDQWGTYVTTSDISQNSAKVSVVTRIKNSSENEKEITLKTIIYNSTGNKNGTSIHKTSLKADSACEIKQDITVKDPTLWSVENPELYTVVSLVKSNGKWVDNLSTPFGIRYFGFDKDKGFSLNGKPMKILGVCDHHDLGCLGSAINTRALQRQLEILKGMGCNGIRTSHNPPAPELLDLCDRMGFIVMDEAFDMWKKGKNPYDYSIYWDKWHEQDLRDQVLRDRNHPSVFIWSIGNEILEQWDSTGITMARELTDIVKSLDTTRPVTSNCNDPRPGNFIIMSGALDLIGFSYHQQDFPNFPATFPGQKFIGSETTSALATRGSYDMPSDSIRRWPKRWDLPLEGGNPDNTCSSYDNCSAPWGSTHEETWSIIKKYDFLSGMYVWTGFDYLGEPTPYGWPSRSSYFGIVDLAGFPKDCYYLYKSEWTKEPVLHIFPHWNWKDGQLIDVWAYTNCDEVELFMNGVSQGVKKKGPDDLHLMWRLTYKPGSIKAIGRTNGKDILTEEIKTAGDPYQIRLTADRSTIDADGNDLSFVTVDILDRDGNMAPKADNLVNFELSGEATIAGVDNGSQTSHEPFQASYRKAFNGKCLVVVRSGLKPGEIVLKAASEGLQNTEITLHER